MIRYYRIKITCQAFRTEVSGFESAEEAVSYLQSMADLLREDVEDIAIESYYG